MTPENFTSTVRRAERRVGRPFAGLNLVEVGADVLRVNGLRVSKDECPGPISVWELYFCKRGETPTFVYGRTIEQAFERAINPAKLVRKRTRKSG